MAKPTPPIAVALALGLALVVVGCDTDPPEARFGVDLLGLLYEVTDPSEGIHPSRAVLSNPNNPFRNANVRAGRGCPSESLDELVPCVPEYTELGIETRFDLTGEGAVVAAFYGWATHLVREPTGEAQFYTALALAGIYEARAVVDEADLEMVRFMAVVGAQTVLDDFPDSVTFDQTGTIPFPLTTPACQLIERLGATCIGWVLVTLSDGSVVAVRSS